MIDIFNSGHTTILFYFREGNLPDISQAGSLHEFLMGLHEKYGKIASFWMGDQLTVSIASPELFKEHSHVFDRPREYILLHLAAI